MAYLVFNSDNSLFRIAANDTDLGNLNLPDPLGSSYNLQTINDSDFESVRKNLKEVSFDGTTITYTDQTWKWPNQDVLNNYFVSIVYDRCEAFLNVNQDSHPMYNSIRNYQMDVQSFDISSLTYPMEISWEEYCSNNSITYYHPLQIP
jgi:hypothetical protein|tara:strand:+ start:2318 stop:2761 length:444 start_codon:yes stop_codon:yes gene_type:complete